uniref:RxLR effector protein n=1 Tax=Phytophthora niederhauseri TaxID=2651253 RepID=A0A3G3MDD8_9STRA|nr:Avh208 protein [Phytophthora niederhauseri]
MRVCSVLLVVAAAVIAISNAAEASTTQLVSPRDVSAIAKVQVVNAAKRFLRSHQTTEEAGEDTQEEDESEERTLNLNLVDDAVAKFKDVAKHKYDLKVDDLLSPHYLNAAENDKGIKKILFKRWATAPAEVRESAIKQLAATGEKWSGLLAAWNKYEAKAATGFPVSASVANKADDLLPKSLVAKANGGDLDMQEKLFKTWIDAAPRIRQDAIEKLKESGNTYSTVLLAWKYSGSRSKAGIDELGFPLRTLDDLLPKGALRKAMDGDVREQNALFSQWFAAPKETREAALQILFDVGKGTKDYRALNNAWLNYLEKLGRTLD